MALQAISFKLAKLSVVGKSTPNEQQTAANANLFILLCDFIIVLPLGVARSFGRRRLVPVSVPAGVILAEQDHRDAAASIGFVRIADTDRLDWLDRTRLRGCRAHSCRRVRIAQSTMYSAARLRRSLLFAGGASGLALCAVGVAIVSTSLCVAN
jgi:hypothetical protein